MYYFCPPVTEDIIFGKVLCWRFVKRIFVILCFFLLVKLNFQLKCMVKIDFCQVYAICRD